VVFLRQVFLASSRSTALRAAFFPLFLSFPLVLPCCASAPPPALSAPVLRYPVILVNGLAVKDGKGPGTWGRIPAFLRGLGIDLYFGGTDAWGRLEANAEILKQRVEEALRETGKDRVNIIAHSAGGIVARRMIRDYGMGARVASLTALNTPHQGSELADFVYRRSISHSPFVKKLFERIGKIQGDLNPAPYELGLSLSTAEMEKFNAAVPPDPQVYYLTIYSTIDSFLDEPLYGWTRRYLDRAAGPNDGIVSEKSTRWHGDRLNAGNNVSHLGILDYRHVSPRGGDIEGNPDEDSGEGVIKIYREILERLAERGF
jgi:triacylglycerol lipase